MHSRVLEDYVEATRTLEALGYKRRVREDRPWREYWVLDEHTLHLAKDKPVPVILIMRARCHALRASIAGIRVLDEEPI